MITVGRTAIGWPVLQARQVPTFEVQLGSGLASFQIRAGDTATILCDLAKRYDATVEPIIHPGPRDYWSYALRLVRESLDIWSEHSGGTALDFRALLHLRGERGTFTPAQMQAIQELLDFYEGVVQWGGNFGLPGHSGHTPDEMHWQINVPPGDPAIARVAAKIRALEDDMSAADVKAITDAMAASEDRVAGKVYDLLTHRIFTGDEAGTDLDKRPPVQISLVGARATLKALDGIAAVSKQLTAIAAATGDAATKEQVQALAAEIDQLVADAQPPAPAA